MSGSSLDGIDIANIEFNDKNQYKILHASTFPIPIHIKKDLSHSNQLNIIEYLELESKYSLFIADVLIQFIKKNNIKAIECISIHGHTVSHSPSKGYSCQMINGGIVSSSTNQDILVDFRSQDIGKNGQGAPLAPIVEKLFPTYNAFCNLGGIANISIHSKTIIAYDICPCNQLFNHIAQMAGFDYDDCGKIGSQGKVNSGLLQQWLDYEFFSKSYPKSIDNNWLKKQFIDTLPKDSPENLMATAYELLAQIIATEFEKKVPKGETVMFTGGGCHNTFLMKVIASKMQKKGLHIYIPPIEIIDFKEALLMAYLGFLWKKGIPSTIPNSTGALKSVMAGALYKGKNG